MLHSLVKILSSLAMVWCLNFAYHKFIARDYEETADIEGMEIDELEESFAYDDYDNSYN